MSRSTGRSRKVYLADLIEIQSDEAIGIHAEEVLTRLM